MKPKTITVLLVFALGVITGVLADALIRAMF
jgi:hypothetical protein